MTSGVRARGWFFRAAHPACVCFACVDWRPGSRDSYPGIIMRSICICICFRGSETLCIRAVCGLLWDIYFIIYIIIL